MPATVKDIFRVPGAEKQQPRKGLPVPSDAQQQPRKELEGAQVLDVIPVRNKKRNQEAVGAAAVIAMVALGFLVSTFMRSGKGRTIAEIKDEKGIAGAVGLVVCGANVTLPNGVTGEAMIGTGSCFAISSDGYLLTNKHVVEETWKAKNDVSTIAAYRHQYQTEIRPTVWVFFGKEKYVADVVHVSSRYDMSVLKIPRRHTPFFRLNRSEQVTRSKRVFACGFPGASMEPLSLQHFAQSPRGGLAAGVEQQFNQRDFEFVMTDGSVSRLFTEERVGHKWIQHNASINPGNSGGPLVDENGTVLGINTLTLAPYGAQGIYMSLAMTQLKSEIEKHATGIVWE